MDFNDTPAEAEFRVECRAWLAANATPRPVASGGDVLAILGTEIDGEAALAEARTWQAKAAADGWAGIGWSREHGGRGATPMEQVIFTQEAARYEVPDYVFRIGVAMGGPTVIAHGTEAQQRRFLPPLLTGEEIWCQLFSEPDAGSDLASLTTSATRDGDGWIVNGQKVWSSGAQYSRWGMLLARTDQEASKHAGITYFILDMELPGLDVRPLRQMTGGAHFNEVFLDDVRIPDDCRIGPVDGGWLVAQTTLLNERAMVGELLGERNAAEPLVDLAHARGVGDDRRVRQQLAAAYIESAIIRYIGLRIVTAFSRGTFPGPEASVAKLAMGRLLQHTTNTALSLLGPAGAVDGDWTTTFLAAPAVRIAGGSDEIQRNIIGERVLGLPKEPRPT